MLYNFVRNLIRSGNGEKELVQKLANSEPMKAAAGIAHDLMNGRLPTRDVYNPKDPRTYHLRDEFEEEDENGKKKEPSSSIGVFDGISKAFDVVGAMKDSLISDISNDINKRKKME